MRSYDKNIDRENIAIFKRHKLKNADELRHKCVLCGKPTCIDDSVSDNGKRLTCMSCITKKFNSMMEAIRFVEGWE